MPDIKFYCTQCGKKMAIDAKAAGLFVTCPDCGTEVEVPGQSGVAPDIAGATPHETQRMHHDEVEPPHRPPHVSIPVAAKPAPHSPGVMNVRPLTPPPVPVPPGIPSPVGNPAHDAEAARLRAEIVRLKDDLAREGEKAKSTAAERDTLSKKCSEAMASISALHDEQARTQREKDGLAARVHSMETENASLKGRLHETEKKLQDAAFEAAAEAERRVRELQSQLEFVAARESQKDNELGKLSEQVKGLEGKLKDSAGRAEELTRAVASAAEAQRALAEEVGALRKERDGLLAQRKEAEKLAATLASVQKQLADAGDREKQMAQALKEKEAAVSRDAPPASIPPSPAGQPWEFTDPFLKMRRAMYICIAVAVVAVVGSVLFVMAWPLLKSGTSDPTADESSSALHQPANSMDDEIIVDDVGVRIQRVSIGPVTEVSMLGKEQDSTDRYLIIDVHLVNRSVDRDLVIQQAWKDARLVDDRGRRLRTAFNEPSMIDEVKGMLMDKTLKPGEEADDKMVFEWNGYDSRSFTLSVDPGFRKPTSGENSVQISMQSFSVEIPRDRIAE